MSAPFYAVVNRQSGRFDVVHIVRATAASWFDSSGTRWIQGSGLMYGAGNYGAKIVSHHATSEAAWAEATERIARAEAAKRDAAARREACDRIRRVVRRSEQSGAPPPTDRLRLAVEVLELLTGDTVNSDAADRILAIARGVE